MVKHNNMELKLQATGRDLTESQGEAEQLAQKICFHREKIDEKSETENTSKKLAVQVSKWKNTNLILPS